jgi:hypothetical protein
MSSWPGKRPIAIVTACLNAEGQSDFAFTEVEATHEEYENGVHIDFAEDRLRDRGYEEPYVHFDDGDGPPFLHPAVRQYLLMPPWVVVRPNGSAS